jgi:hypothetical protein
MLAEGAAQQCARAHARCRSWRHEKLERWQRLIVACRGSGGAGCTNCQSDLSRHRDVRGFSNTGSVDKLLTFAQ